MLVLERLLHRTLSDGAVELRVVDGSPPTLIDADRQSHPLTPEAWDAARIRRALDPLLDDARRAALRREGHLELRIKVGDYHFAIRIVSKGAHLGFQARPQAIASHQRRESSRDRDLRLQRVHLDADQLARLTGRGRAGLLERLLDGMAEHGASDLHLRRNRRPCYRITGSILALEQLKPLDEAALREVVYAALRPPQIEELERELSIDFSYRSAAGGRFRINVFHEAGAIGLAARRVSTDIPTFESLNLPPQMEQIPRLLEGLVLVCGVTGSGKSTTLAATVEVINRTGRCNIVTLEDPVEYAYASKQSLVAQREVGIDCLDWTQGLRHLLRQDPDVILIGEMRDAETFAVALQAAETGHLVLSTLHTSSAAQVPGRVLELFHPARHVIVRQSLAANLRAVVCQRLMPARGGGMIPAVEFLLVNPAIQKLIREGRDHVIDDVILGDEEMRSLNESLKELIERGAILPEIGLEHSPKPERLRMMLKGIRLDDEHRGGIGGQVRRE